MNFNLPSSFLCRKREKKRAKIDVEIFFNVALILLKVKKKSQTGKLLSKSTAVI